MAEEARVFRVQTRPATVAWVLALGFVVVVGLFGDSFLNTEKPWPWETIVVPFLGAGLIILGRWFLRAYREVRIGSCWIFGPTQEILGPRRMEAKDIQSIHLAHESETLIIAGQGGWEIQIYLPDYGTETDELLRMAYALHPAEHSGRE